MRKTVWETKCWGVVAHIFCSEHAAVSVLRVNKGFRCSRHLHRQRNNLFTVISGKVIIEQWWPSDDGCALREDVLSPGDTLQVASGIEHRFRVLESGEMVEVYWPEFDGDKVSIEDIERADEGGKDV